MYLRTRCFTRWSSEKWIPVINCSNCLQSVLLWLGRMEMVCAWRFCRLLRVNRLPPDNVTGTNTHNFAQIVLNVAPMPLNLPVPSPSVRSSPRNSVHETPGRRGVYYFRTESSRLVALSIKGRSVVTHSGRIFFNKVQKSRSFKAKIR